MKIPPQEYSLPDPPVPLLQKSNHPRQQQCHEHHDSSMDAARVLCISRFLRSPLLDPSFPVLSRLSKRNRAGSLGCADAPDKLARTPSVSRVSTRFLFLSSQWRRPWSVPRLCGHSFLPYYRYRSLSLNNRTCPLAAHPFHPWENGW